MRSLKLPSQIRWNILFNILLWSLMVQPIGLPLLYHYVPSAHYYIPLDWSLYWLHAIQAIMTLAWLVTALLALITFGKVLRAAKNSSDDCVCEESRFTHLVCLAVYKEPVDVLIETIDSIARQTVASRVVLVVGLEERTPELDAKISKLRELYAPRLKQLMFTVHPSGTPGEIPGKCSNSNYAFRQAEKSLSADGQDMDSLLVTTCDADTKLHPRFLEELEVTFTQTDNPHRHMYQAPLLYNWKLDELSCVTRVTAILRSALMMGALIPFNINTMSIYSFSGKLLKEGDFIHPGYQMDDIIGLIRCMGTTKQSLKIACVPVFNLSGPTSGRVIEEELEEWARQARRWTIGAGEVFHYFLIKSTGIPLWTSITWGAKFTTYYCILLCGSSLFSIELAAALVVIKCQNGEVSGVFTYLSPSFLAVTYLTLAVYFFLDWRAPKLLDPPPTERISLLRNVLHFLASPLVILAYSLVEFYALHELLLFGKSVCKHGASKKQGLSSGFKQNTPTATEVLRKVSYFGPPIHRDQTFEKPEHSCDSRGHVIAIQDSRKENTRM